MREPGYYKEIGRSRVLFVLLAATLPVLIVGGVIPTLSVSSSISQPGLLTSGVVTCNNVNSQTTENVPVTIDVLANCHYIINGEQQTLQVQSITQPSNGVASINPDNTVSYIPSQSFTGQDTFQFTASDPSGLETSSANVYVTVNPASTTTSTTSSTTSATVSTSTTTTASTNTSSTSTTTTSTTLSSSTTASRGTSVLTVEAQLNGGGAMTGFYTILFQNSKVVATGYTPVQFTVNNELTYQIQVDGYSNYYFQYWQNTGSVNPNMTVITSTSLSETATLCNGPPGACPDPTPVNGITVYAHRIPASYWAPCFATACSAGTGPGASMYFDLEDSSGNVIQSGYADESGYTFTGLAPGQTYYIFAENCNLCHGSTHDVVFQYWGDNSSTANPIAATVGTSLDAWYSCTNLCSGG